ncbi:tRNA (N6-threonylcarbamoyladenosine(37)-N6)-methyltransferase TrmO [Acinetobacter sp. ANC 4648]|uniref:tRNA (N6-threonylcarbamoyladenosine(37)-N6)-methyltransferase TrmO n=1 Tax=Acinetobacter sp. ANC 4648 TaxID=1977875 RepID=UPI000A35B125|nr:tRNA (N6-threonylcarbamoyladenosine(37)-N6)-methyltransferase TrmO [Acinetobacter sp. ANC 4648]OTG81789.1 tRNA (N6-threonylcarbamoyladenosine(37)-N6)-methyltransferase TrmO [Acinetobacter sp. ANC 4648]
MTEVSMPIIGYMRSPYKEKFGIPRQPNLVQVESYIEMLAPYNDLMAFEGIEEFSHLWLIWQFHDNKNQQDHHKFRPQVRPPRLGGNKKIGVFATRSMYRPAPMGLSVVQLRIVKKVGKSIRVYVTGSDLLDGTPIFDIKPYIHYSDAIMDAQSAYAQERPSIKSVLWSDLAEQEKAELIQSNQVDSKTFSELEQILSLDPRPAYQEDEHRIYKMQFANVDVSFIITFDSVKIIQINSLISN